MSRHSSRASTRLLLWRALATAAAAAVFWLGVPIYLHAGDQDSLTVTITPRDGYPPAPVTDLNATAGAIGQMLLEWTAPDESDNKLPTRSPATSYTIKYATFSVDSVGDAALWWTQANTASDPPTPSDPGLRDSMLINGLPPGFTYYLGLKSVDANENVSDLDTHATTAGQQTHVFLPAGRPNAPDPLSGVALSSTSVRWSWTSILGASGYRLEIYPSNTLIVLTPPQSGVDETSLLPNTPTTRQVRTVLAGLISDPTAPKTVYTLAAVPTNLTATDIGSRFVKLAWRDDDNPSQTRYRVERSTDGITFSSVTILTEFLYRDVGLTPSTHYFYRVSALNGDDVASVPSSVLSATTLQLTDVMPPDIPAGLLGSLDPTGRAFTLVWEAVTRNADETPLTDLDGYNIYRRTRITDDPVKLNPLPLTTNAFADVVNGQTFYYTVRAVDINGNESPDSLLADSSSDSNIIFFSPSGSAVQLPDSISSLLRSDHNPFGVPLSLTVTELPASSENGIVRTVRLNFIRTDTKAVVSDVYFEKPDALVSISYNLANGDVAIGPLSNGFSNQGNTGVTPDKLSLFWNNGVTWINVGGTLDVSRQALSVHTSFLGEYQLRIAGRSTALNLSQGNVFPRVFTPNGDGLNDVVYFVFENPNNATVSGEILDEQGRFVSFLAPPPSGGVGTTLIWDGKNSSGALVASGLYIYKVQGEGKTFSGTVAVAR